MDNQTRLNTVEHDEGLTAEEAELAAQLQKIQHPELPEEKSRQQRMAAASLARSLRPGPRPTWRMLPIGALIIVLLMAVFLLASPTAAQTAALQSVNGVVEINAGGVWQPVADGARLEIGQHIRTRLGSSVTLLFPDGSLASLAPETELVLAQLSRLPGKGIQVELQQLAGVTDHSVIPLKGTDSYYLVNTTNGQASVHGTAFSVDMNGQQTLFTVKHGAVQVSSDLGSVMLTDGQTTLSDPINPPDEPAYEFNLQGPLQAVVGEQWTVQGVVITVPADVLGDAVYVPGDLVFVRGRITTAGWVADRVSLTWKTTTKAHFTGLVEATGDLTWQVGGVSLLVDAGTEISPELAVGSAVEVSFTVLPDGRWLAESIKALDAEEDDGDMDETPRANFTPPGQDPSRIPPGQLKKTPTALDLTLTPGEITPSPEPTEEDDGEGERSGICASEKQQPEALRLAEKYAVTYEVIMGWFCQGYGLGEIDLAYEMSLETSLPVDQIFAMRAAGSGWGSIKQELTPKETKVPRTPKPTKTPKPKN